MGELVTFDGVSLESVQGLRVLRTDPHRPPQRDINKSKIAQSNKIAISSAFYGERKVNVRAELGRDSKAEFQASMQQLEKILQGVEKALVFEIAGVSSYFTATKQNIALQAEYGGFAEVDIEFICSDPVYYAVAETTLYNYPALVGGAYNFAVTWAGNIAQKPRIEYTLTTVTGGTAKSVTISNPNNGQSLVIQRTWSNGDEIIVDTQTGDVLVNDEPADYSGRIPEWSGTDPVHYEDNFTTRNFAIDISYHKGNI